MIEITQAALLLFLFVGAALDARDQEIPAYLLLIGFGAGILFRILSGNAAELPTGCIPGGLLLAASWISKEAVGYGDGGMLVCVGMYLSFSENLMLTILSLLLAAVCAGVLLAAKKIKRRESLPFLPFLLAGYVILLSG